jgi:ABC-2 type transport system permease protein
LIATAFHIIVLSFAIVTLEVDHTVMIYRDLTSLGRLPIDIYQQPLKAFLTYLIPVGIMITLPAKAIMGLTSLPEVLIAFLVGLIAIFISFKFWNYALTKYSSASS